MTVHATRDSCQSLPCVQDTEIWLPDLQPYNTDQGIISTLDPSTARGTSDGSIFWSRPGILDVMVPPTSTSHSHPNSLASLDSPLLAPRHRSASSRASSHSRMTR